MKSYLKTGSLMLMILIALSGTGCEKEEKEETVALQSIAIDKGTAVELRAGQTLQLDILKTPGNATVT